MKRLPLLLAAFATLLSLFAISTPAEAHGRIRGGVFLNFGVPWPGYWGYWGPRYYYPGPYYYYDDYYAPSTVIIERRSPPEYVEKADVEGRSAPSSEPATAAAPAPSQVRPTNWWYWCESSKKYYPYVKECAGGFERVPPQAVPPANR